MNNQQNTRKLIGGTNLYITIEEESKEAKIRQNI